MNDEINLKVLVATHKAYKMPDDNMYLPIHVGKKDKCDIGFLGDNTGDNISDKNLSFCELTGLYWAWKNLECDYIGLAHYRRHFKMKKYNFIKKDKKFDYILSYDEAKRLLNKYRIILPKKRKYYIETLYSHYAHTHYAEHLDITKEIIQDKYPKYMTSFNKIMKSRSGYMFNMYIMDKSLSDEYCSWLFDILFELEKRIDTPELSLFQGRFYGRVSEIIFNCWLDYQIRENNIPIREIGCIHMENINWIKKGGAFLKAKFYHEKYESGF